MQFEKIKQVKADYHDGTGPSETVTLGFKAGERSFILGCFYRGPYMTPDHDEELEKVEAVIDELVRLSSNT